MREIVHPADCACTTCRPRVVNIRTDHCDVYCGRPSPWGNPHPIGWCARCGKQHTRAEAIEAFRVDTLPKLTEAARRELKGKILGCWCKPRPCHADLLAEVANT